MLDDLVGPLWVVIVAAVVTLAAALMYGMIAWKRKRNTTLEGIRNDATRKLYRDDDEGPKEAP